MAAPAAPIGKPLTPNDPAQQPGPPQEAMKSQKRTGGPGLLQRLVRRAFVGYAPGPDRLPFQGRNRKPLHASCNATWTSIMVLISSSAASRLSKLTSNRALQARTAAA